jgi:FixJ family two-component response regulator
VGQLVQGLDDSNDQEELFNSLSERQRKIISLVVERLSEKATVFNVKDAEHQEPRFVDV